MTPSWIDLVKDGIEAVSSKNTIIFYSKNQLPIFSEAYSESERFKRVLITGGFGTGKTILLSEKAEIMAHKDTKFITL